MNPIDKVDTVLDNVSPDLSGIAPRKTNVHVQEKDGSYVVLTEDDRYIGILNSEFNDNIKEYNVEIRSVRHSTPDHSVGHVMVRLRKKSQSNENDGKPIDSEAVPQQQQEQEEELNLFSKKQLEMLVARKDLSVVFSRDNGLGDWVRRVVEASNQKEKEAVVQQLLSDPESSQLIDHVMGELSKT